MTNVKPPLKAVSVKFDAIYIILERSAKSTLLLLKKQDTGEEVRRVITFEQRITLRNLPNGIYELSIAAQSNGALNTPGSQTHTLELTINCNPIYQLFKKIKEGNVERKNLIWALKNNAHFAKLFHLYRMAHSTGGTFEHWQKTNEKLLAIFLEESDFNVAYNSLLLIAYTIDKQTLIKSHHELFLKFSLLPENDQLNFSKGLIAHKVDNFDLAETQFAKIDYSCCADYMHPAKNYKYLIEPVEKHENEIVFVKSPKTTQEFIFLISCDYSYFLAYIDTLLDTNKTGINIHFHLILNQRELLELKTIQQYATKSNNGLSYSLAPRGTTSEGIKTYYACARYIFLDQIFKIYEKSIIVIDIDMNFSTLKISDLDSQVDENRISLLFSARDLPWANIMAGFNYFGKNTFPSTFVHYTKNFIECSYRDGKSAWTLDQMALNYAYRSLSLKEKSLILPLFPKSSQLGYVSYYRRRANEIKQDINKNGV